VKDVEKAVKTMEEKGIHLGYITKDGIFDTGGTKIAYLDPRDTDGILIELIEAKSWVEMDFFSNIM